ncbi:MAG: ABC transporter permease [Candidatus Porifericomitaceae bacterium WSBS_2022_MAG_OTU9]
MLPYDRHRYRPTVALYTIVRKEVQRLCRIWVQTLLPPIISTFLYFIIFGSLIGQRIGEMQGHSYVEYITPGIIMMTIINNAYANVSSSFFSAKFQGYIEEMLISPMSNLVILCGYISGGIVRGVVVGLIVTLVASMFQDISIHDPLLVLATTILASTMFSLGGVINGIVANSFDDISIVPTFILAPLTYLGGVFYSISLLPGIWYDISLFNPILYIVNAFRFAFIGSSDVNITWAITMMVACTTLLGATAWWMMQRGTGIKN